MFNFPNFFVEISVKEFRFNLIISYSSEAWFEEDWLHFCYPYSCAFVRHALFSIFDKDRARHRILFTDIWWWESVKEIVETARDQGWKVRMSFPSFNLCTNARKDSDFISRRLQIATSRRKEKRGLIVDFTNSSQDKQQPLIGAFLKTQFFPTHRSIDNHRIANFPTIENFTASS